MKSIAPALLISHNGPSIILDKSNQLNKNLNYIGSKILQEYAIKAVIIISAHFESNGNFKILSQSNPQTVHDHGFNELFNLQYKALNDIVMVDRIISDAKAFNLNIRKEDKWGYDHGTWSAMLALFQTQVLQTIQISVDLADNNLERHFLLGKLLEKYRQEGYLLVCSGSVTHNLQIAFSAMRGENVNKYKQTPEIIEFDKQIIKILGIANYNERTQALLQLKQKNTYKISHPTDDHFLPVSVFAGIGGDKGAKLFNTKENSVLSESCFMID